MTTQKLQLHTAPKAYKKRSHALNRASQSSTWVWTSPSCVLPHRSQKLPSPTEWRKPQCRLSSGCPERSGTTLFLSGKGMRDTCTSTPCALQALACGLVLRPVRLLAGRPAVPHRSTRAALLQLATVQHLCHDSASRTCPDLTAATATRATTRVGDPLIMGFRDCSLRQRAFTLGSL
jgi:hypothetical protein